MTAAIAEKHPIKSYKFGRLPFYTDSLPAMERCLNDWFCNGARQNRLLGFLNPHVYNHAGREPAVWEFLQACDMLCIDGIGTAVASRFLFGQSVPRVVATELFECALAWPSPPVDAVLIGGTPLQAERAAVAINDAGKRGAWKIVKAYSGFMDIQAYQNILRRHSRVDAVLVGAGTPRSEKILLDALAICKNAICWHIGGGTIGIYAGDKRKAPAWISAWGMEWMHRFIYESHYRPRIYTGIFEFAGRIVKERFLNQ